MPIDTAELPAFLVEAKRRSYAAQGDAASVTPVLAGSKQLEYRAGRFHYRDIYFGLACFAGQETVSLDDRVIWAMSYAGGIASEIRDRADVMAIYAFLRQALLRVSAGRPFRGPQMFEAGDFRYEDGGEGDIAAFRGTEHIRRAGTPVYRLDYCGGIVR